MAHPYWPLFDLVVRTPRLELRHPTDDDLVAMAELARDGVHPPATMPFEIPWTDVDPPAQQRESLQWWWRCRAEWRPEEWRLALMVSEIDASGATRVVGVQDVQASDFALSQTFTTGSWLGLAHQGSGIGKEMRAAVLHLGFAGLGARRAETSAWHDNGPSLGVTRSLGYRPNGDRLGRRRGRYDRALEFVLERDNWEQARRHDIVVEGLDQCLPLFGVDRTA